MSARVQSETARGAAPPKRVRGASAPATAEDLEVEGGFKAPLLKAINATPGLRAWRQQAGSLKVRGGFMVLAPAGAADIVGRAAPDGLHFEVETKGRKTEVEASQDPWALETRGAGAVYVRARPAKGEPIAAARVPCKPYLRSWSAIRPLVGPDSRA